MQHGYESKNERRNGLVWSNGDITCSRKKSGDDFLIGLDCQRGATSRLKVSLTFLIETEKRSKADPESRSFSQ
jgi:hypothetical protein